MAAEAPPEDGNRLPQSLRKWHQLPGKMASALLTALDADLDPETLAPMHPPQDRLHLLAYALQLSPNDQLLHGCRTFTDLQEACVDRYNCQGALLSLPSPWGLRRFPGKGLLSA